MELFFKIVGVASVTIVSAVVTVGIVVGIGNYFTKRYFKKHKPICDYCKDRRVFW
jgi:hypothetical protein